MQRQSIEQRQAEGETWLPAPQRQYLAEGRQQHHRRGHAKLLGQSLDPAPVRDRQLPVAPGEMRRGDALRLAHQRQVGGRRQAGDPLAPIGQGPLVAYATAQLVFGQYVIAEVQPWCG